MNNLTKFLILLPIIGLLVFASPQVQASALYARTPNSQLNVGNSFSVNLRLDTQGEDLNAVATSLSYPADKLEVAFITTGTDFPILAEQNVGSGTIKLAQGTIDPVNGEVSLATIVFRTKAAGVADLNFLEDSAALRFSDSSDSLNLSQSQGTNLVILDNEVLGELTQNAEPNKLLTLSFTQLWNLLFTWL